MIKSVIYKIFIIAALLSVPAQIFAASFDASSKGCPAGTTPSTEIAITETAFRKSIPIIGPFIPNAKKSVCTYEPPPSCPTGQELIGAISLREFTGEDTFTGGQCYVRGSEEARQALQGQSNMQNAIGSTCQSGFLYVENVDGKKCYKDGSPEYRLAVEKAKMEKLSTGKVGGEVKEYVIRFPIPCQPILGGQCPKDQTPAGYIGRLYQFGLMIVGLAAFASIVFGALRYILSAGNLASIEEAKDQIKQAIMGVILLLGAYLILYTINPGLVSLRNPNLEPIRIQEIIQDAQVSEDIQRLPPGGSARGGGDSLCKVAANSSITVNSVSSRSSVCVTCTTNATKGQSGACQCNQGFVQHEDACITPTEAEGLPDRSITDEPTCNKTFNRIWRNGQCFHEDLGF